MKPDTTFRLGKTSITKDEHDEVMKTRNRPITQGPMQRRRAFADDVPGDGMTIVDQYVSEASKDGGR